MKLSNHHVARILMIIVIIASVIYGNMRSMSREALKVIEVFEMGEDRDGLSAHNDLLGRCNHSINMNSLANRYNYSSNSLKELNDIASEMKLLLSEPSLANFNKLATLNSELTNEFDSVYEELITRITKDMDKSLLIGLYDYFHYSGNILSHSDYNEVALEYNELVESFPNNILSLFNKSQRLTLLGEYNYA